MSRRPLLVVVALAVAAGLAPARAGDPPPFRLEEHVGADTLAFVALDGFPGGWRDALATSGLSALLDDAGVRHELRPMLELLRVAWARSGVDEAFAAHLASALCDLGERGSARLSVAWTGTRQDGTPAVSVALDFGEHLAALTDLLTTTLREPPRGWTSGARADRSTILTAGEDAWVVTVEGTTVLLVRADAQHLPAESAAGSPPPGNPLAGRSEFADVWPARPRDRVGLDAWVDLARIVGRAVEDPTSGFGKTFAHASGLDAMTTLTYAAAVTKDGVTERLHVRTDRAERGVFRLFETAPLSHAPAPFGAARPLASLEASLPLSSAPARWRAFLHDVDREDEADFDTSLERLDHVLGRSLERDLLPRLVDEQTLSIGLPAGSGLVPEVALSIPVKDAAAFEGPFAAAVDGLCGYVADRGAGHVTQRALGVDGATMHVIEQHGSDTGEDWPCSPTWALVGDRLVVTAVPHAMRSILRRVSSAAAAPEGRAAGPASARALGTACTISTRELVTGAYETLVPLAEAVPSWRAAARGVGFDPAMLPDATRVAQAWSDTSIGLRVGADGVRLEATSPIGVVPLLTILLVALRASEAPEEAVGAAYEPSSVVHEPNPADDPEDLTRAVLEHAAIAVREFRSLRGALPQSLDDLVTVEPLLRAIPRDAWGRPIRLRTAHLVAVTSAGKDGVFGTDDDLERVVDVPGK